jgi:hypothetical protein
MTEAEWLVCEDPRRMLSQVGVELSRRKLLLYGAAIARRHPDLLDFYGARGTLELVERFADGEVSESELAEDLMHFSGLLDGVAHLDAIAVLYAAEFLQRTGRPAVQERVRRVQADLLRDIAGNPFRPCALDPLWLQTNDRLIVRLAQTAADHRREPEGNLEDARLAVLGDALEEAGCTDGQILSHLRARGPHVRGCWAVDLLLDRY